MSSRIMMISVAILVIWAQICHAQFGFLSPKVGLDPIRSGAEFLKPQLQKVINNTVPVLGKLLEAEWSTYTKSFGKIYKSAAEEAERKLIFVKNRANIDEFNKQFKEGIHSFTQKINPFFDLTHEEFITSLNGFNRATTPSSHAVKGTTMALHDSKIPVPESIDWRKKGAVNNVRSQGLCAACWAFAAAGALEGHYFKKTGNLVEVSVQHLIDCTESYGNSGCKGGLMDPAFQYVKEYNGINSEKSYPFKGNNSECNTDIKDILIKSTGFVDIPQNDEKALEIAVGTIGPVTAAIDANRNSFQFYSSGVYDDPECGNRPEQLNHGVLIVGYGKESNGKKYWLVKNSYGPEWGIEGYVKIAKDNGNQCGIAVQTSYPLI